jgi:hypothetical protein
MLKRLLSILCAASLLHLTLLSEDVRCADHGAGNQASQLQGAIAQHHGHGNVVHGQHSHTVHAAAPADGSTQDCDIPAVPKCCLTFASCGVTVALDAARHESGSGMRDASRGDISVMELESRFAAPEPPPPRV